MNGQILIGVDAILDSADDGSGITQAMYNLADELNSALPGYECAFVHLDGRNFLGFTPGVSALTVNCPGCGATAMCYEIVCPGCSHNFGAQRQADSTPDEKEAS